MSDTPFAASVAVDDRKNAEGRKWEAYSGLGVVVYAGQARLGRVSNTAVALYGDAFNSGTVCMPLCRVREGPCGCASSQ